MKALSKVTVLILISSILPTIYLFNSNRSLYLGFDLITLSSQRTLCFCVSTYCTIILSSKRSFFKDRCEEVIQKPTPRHKKAALYSPSSDNYTPTIEMSVSRVIRTVLLAVEQAEGAGARVRRSVGTPQLRNFSPFLMLDHFFVKPGAGFPDHPHRGQETITYLLEGGFDHEDFCGNAGTLSAGDLQFMTAGRGIVHAEMPRQNADGSANVGLQLWVDLPQKLKSCEPRYRDLRAAEIPVAHADSNGETDSRVTIKVISGQSHGVDSVRDLAYTPVWILDVTIQPGGKITQPIPVGWNAFAYILEGEVVFGQEETRRTVSQYHNAVFEQEGDHVVAQVENGAKDSARFVIIAGLPLDQPVVQYGPFVLSSPQEVRQALVDYQSYSNGFERAEGWQSEIGKSMGNL